MEMSFPRECECNGEAIFGCGIHSSFGVKIPKSVVVAECGAGAFDPSESVIDYEAVNAWTETVGAEIKRQNYRVYYRAVANLAGWSAARFNAEARKIATETAAAASVHGVRVSEQEFLPMGARGIAVNLRIGEARLQAEIKRLNACEYANALAKLG
jgi:hypothetical protein